MDIQNIDKNLQVETSINKPDIVFYDCLDARFDLYGVIPPQNGDEKFLRMPEEVADKANDGVKSLNACTAGGRLRLKTDSEYIAVHAELTRISKMPHMAFTGSLGFDLYEIVDGKEIYRGTFVPPVDTQKTFEAVIGFSSAESRDLLINFPLYSGVEKLYIGLSDKATVEAPSKYKYDIPVVYYGSSITQGGCASRPGNSYQQIISRRLGCDYINLGFSGSAKGERCMAEYIAGLKMSVFVYDYDHNSPSVETLEATHKPMFDVIRRAQPSLPIIMASWTPTTKHPNTDERFEVIKKTYDIAKSEGDENVYLLDGRRMFDGICEDNGTVDGCHPNDWGFSAMAKAIGDAVEVVISNRAYIDKE